MPSGYSVDLAAVQHRDAFAGQTQETYCYQAEEREVRLVLGETVLLDSVSNEQFQPSFLIVTFHCTTLTTSTINFLDFVTFPRIKKTNDFTWQIF